jgi:hypothetical protein
MHTSGTAQVQETPPCRQQKESLLPDCLLDTIDYVSRQDMNFMGGSCMRYKISHKFLIVRAARNMAAIHSQIFTGK